MHSGPEWPKTVQNSITQKLLVLQKKFVKYEMSIYAKTKSLLICVYSVLGEFSRIFLLITTKLHFTVSTPNEQFHIFKF